MKNSQLARTGPSLVLAIVSVILSAGLQRAGAQGDNFDDGNSDGWTELAPLEAVGGSGTFSFPNGNSYRMQSAASPDAAFGPPRIGSARTDVSYEDFYMSVDLVDWDPALDQNMGVLARIRQLGLGTLDGYGVTYNPTDQKMFFSVITDEQATNIDVDVSLPQSTPVRMIFQGSGPNLKAELFALDDLVTPVATIETTDHIYTSGFCGIFNSSDGTSIPTDTTFDNYFAAAAEPVDFRVLRVELDGDNLVFDFLSKPGQQYSLFISNDLVTWSEFDDGITGAAGPITTHTHTPTKAVPAGLRQFYQFRTPG